ncbi:MAG TPA: VWA domain-containing protein [Bryobacteraceae bacterium]|nr:VWA domain-containing protein [Bryobacteraceae bacterium]
MRRSLIFSLISSLIPIAAQDDITFRATSNLVVVDVFVRDRSGHEMPGLKKEDFTVLEDGKPQKVSVFEYQKLSDEPLPEEPAFAPRTPERPQAVQSLTTAPKNDMLRYQDRRLIIFFFDLSSMQPPEQARARKSALEFVSKQMTKSDLVAIMTYSNEVKILQDFTADRDLLAADIRGLALGDNSDRAAIADTGDDTSGADTGAAFVADETEFNIFNTDEKLAALETASKLLAALPQKKALVYFSGGINKTGVENQSQLRSTVNAAIKANISFYPIDAHGLIALVPGGDASQAASRGAGMFNGSAVTTQRNNLMDAQETLVTLASDTGGKALLDNNDLTRGITQAQDAIRSYYILGYYSTNPAQDGRYRHIQVKLTPGVQAKLDYRQGYFAPKSFGKFSSADKEEQLQQALMLGDPVTELPLALEVNYFRLNPKEYFVPVAVKIPGSSVELGKKGSNEVTEFDFIGEVLDGKGQHVSTVRDGIRVKIDPNNQAQLARRNFEYDTGFTLPPGNYDLKFLARENRTGKMGTFETKFTVPDLTARSDYLHVSSVVWSNQREALQAAVGAAGNQKKADAANPLVDGGRKLIPSVTRVFRKDQNLYVYLEAYDPTVRPELKKPNVVASVSFYRGKVKAFETPSVRLDDTAPKRAGTLPIQFQMPLAKLPPGRYVCQVNVVDQIGKKFAFSRAPLVLLP